MVQVKERKKERGVFGRKVNPNWDSLTSSTKVGTRLLALEVAEALGISNAAARNYFNGSAFLPRGWKVGKVGKTVFLERVKG